MTIVNLKLNVPNEVVFHNPPEVSKPVREEAGGYFTITSTAPKALHDQLRKSLDEAKCTWKVDVSRDGTKIIWYLTEHVDHERLHELIVGWLKVSWGEVAQFQDLAELESAKAIARAYGFGTEEQLAELDEAIAELRGEKTTNDEEE